MAKAGKVVDRDLGYRAVVRGLKDLKKKSGMAAYVGVHGDEGSEIVIIAASNEFGTADGHIPERSYLRSTVDEHVKEIADILQKAVIDAIDGKRSIEDSLALLGEEAVGWVKMKIRLLDTPPNAPSTIAAKGSDNPLIATGQNLRARIRSEVR